MPNNNNEYGKIRVLILYHPDEQAFKVRLRNHLSTLTNNAIADIWDEEMIIAGANREAEIQQQIQIAQIALFLISSSSIASESLDNHLKRVISRSEKEELFLIPVKVKSFHLKGSYFEHCQILPRNGNPVNHSSWNDADEPYKEISEETTRLCEQISQRQRTMLGGKQPINPEFYELEHSFISLPDVLVTGHPKFEEYVVKSHTMAHFTIFKEQLSDIRIRMKNRRRNFTGGNMGDIDLVIELLKDINERLQKQKPEFIKKYWKDVESTIADAIQIRKEISKTNYNDPEEMDYAIVAYIYPLCEKIEEFEILCSQMAKHSIIDSMGPIHLN